MLPKVGIVKLGTLKYLEGLEIQKNVANIIKDKSTIYNGILLMLEHFPVYTIGIRTKGYTTKDEEYLKKIGADFYRTDRGGLITFHGPGQLVVYPILDLKFWRPSVRYYVNNLESTIICVCNSLSIKAKRLDGYPGIWTEKNEKICAIGVHASRYVTTHGIGLNCNTDLNWFKHIIPCGIEGKNVTSISQELNKSVPVDNIIPLFLDCFLKYFPCEIIDDKLYTIKR